jgi:hypothetical protein
MTSNIDATVPVTGTPTTASQRANWATAKSEISALQAASGGAVGPAGPAGPAGSPGQPMLSGSGAPSGVQPTGTSYLDAATGDVWHYV